MKINLRTMLLLAGVLLIASDPLVLAHTDVTVEEARDLIASTSDLTVVDVREPYEYCDTRGHIPRALNYPWSSGVLRTRYEELPADGPVLVVCRSGGRSNAAASFLDSKGFSEVYDMLRGMNAWQWETTPCKYSGGAGTADNPYQIATAADLIALGETPEDYDKHFVLAADIDLDPNLPGQKVFDKAVIAPDVVPNMQGFQGELFNGVFNGNGHTISHLTIKGVNSVGLFGMLDSEARISDLDLVAVDVNGEAGIGSLVGTNNGTVANIYSTGIVNGNLEVGGLAGANGLGSITSSHSSGEVSGSEDVGGLVGINLGSITASSSSGMVTGDERVGGLVGWSNGGIAASSSTGTVTGNRWIGGLVGDNYGGITTSHSTATVSSTAKLSAEGASLVGHIGGLVGSNAGSIATSYSLGEVNGPANVGGLVGSSGGSIANCYNTGSVNGYENVGGLVGISHGSLTLSYSTGLVGGNDKIGGLVGYNYHKGNVIACFWDIVASGLPNMCGAQEDEATGCDDSHGKITAEMQTPSTFLEAGWDFVDEVENGPNDVWWICEGQAYPRLWWESPKHVFEVEIALGADYEDPDDPNDTVHEFELMVVTDGGVQRLEFVTPSGSLFEIPNLPQHEQPVPGGWLETAWEYDDEAGVYEWSYEMKLDDPNGLADFGDGNYEIVTYYEDGTQEQTNTWFGLPGTNNPIPQPVQEPVMTSLSDGDVLTSPVAITWKIPTDPAINQVLVALTRQDAPEWLEFELGKDATGIGELLFLSESPWSADLVFAASYSYKNADKVQIECIKYTESGYTFTVAP